MKSIYPFDEKIVGADTIKRMAEYHQDNAKCLQKIDVWKFLFHFSMTFTCVPSTIQI